MTPLVEELVPAPDPVETCARCLDLPHLVFLDSAATDHRDSRYSFLAADPVAVVRSPPEPRPLAAARALLAPHRVAPLAGLPPFQGGIAGWVGYDWGAAQERVERAHPAVPVPDVVLGLYDWVIAWDHGQHRAWIVSTGIGEEGEGKRERRARLRLSQVKRRVMASPAHGSTRSASPRPPSSPVANFSRADYEAAVRRVREYIAAGDVFQVNLAQRFSAPFSGAPFALYQRVRARTPAPFAAYVASGDVVIVSASPERFLRLTGDRVEARPIKGTRPRGATPAADALLAGALRASEKDRAENVMIVDVLRNDLGRVCRWGSVMVPELATLESHPTVHHLVSTVTGSLAPEHDAFDLLAATFPGGSITGAPKIRAMQIIAELERGARGPYCGAIGYISTNGAMDLSIVIRTCVIASGAVSYHVGGGITAESEPAAEYQETLDKGAALHDALTLTSPRKSSRRRGRARRRG